MKLPRKPRKKARIEIIPMIDTMFFLLVFFMVATLSMTVQRGLPVNLPHAASARDEIRQVTTLTLTKDNRLYFDKEELASPAEASLRLASQTKANTEVSVVINADRAVEHGRVIDLMDAVRQAGVTRIAVAVRPLSRGK
ncbi:MAG: biopolymer transporter ExbD [Proteobacteria bacterium]|nr:biopolymer transporter ExbD [Pseudomonadota bacterium]